MSKKKEFKPIHEIVKEGVTEAQWRRFHAWQNRKEREYVSAGQEKRRLIRKGIIVPPYVEGDEIFVPYPQMMYKDKNGRWCPKLSIHHNWNRSPTND